MTEKLLSELTTAQVGGPAKTYVRATSEAEIIEAVSAADAAASHVGPPGRAFGSREVPFFMLPGIPTGYAPGTLFRIFSHAYRIPLPIGFHRRQYSIYSVRNKKYP